MRRARKRAGITAREQDELDRMARWIVMVRAGAALVTDEGREQWWGACEKCHTPHWLSWCHVFTRAAWCTRWDSENAFAWCSGCHRWMDQHAEDKRQWVTERIGVEEYEAMHIRSKGTKPDGGAWRLWLEHEAKQMGLKIPARVPAER